MIVQILPFGTDSTRYLLLFALTLCLIAYTIKQYEAQKQYKHS